MSKRDIAAFFQRGPAALLAHTRGVEEARPSSEAPAAQTPVLEEVTNRTAVTMDADLREPAGGDGPRGGEDVLPATAAVPAQETAHLRVFSRKRPAAAAVAVPPHGCVSLPALWRARSALALCLTLSTLASRLPPAVRSRSTHAGDAVTGDTASVPPAVASTPAGRAKLKQLHLDVGQVRSSCVLPAHTSNSQVMLSGPA